MPNNNLDVRVYPIEEPKGSTIAFASIAIDDLAAIRGVRVVNGSKGLFVAMPQSQDNDGKYRDVAFPLTGSLRKEISTAVLCEFKAQLSLTPDQRGYKNAEPDTRGGKHADDVNLDVKVFPIAGSKGDTLAFASIGLDDTVAIRGIRVVKSDKGQYISMPQSKDKDGIFHDIAFPLSGDLRRAVSTAVLAEYSQILAERKQSIGARLAEGKEQAAQLAAANAPGRSATKKSPGRED